METKVGTHSGRFHSDEVVAYSLLSLVQRLHPLSIVRTRDEVVLDKCDVLIDVGGIYDPDKNRFDHHQVSFTETFSKSSKITLSSAGLVFLHFGKEIISTQYSSLSEDDVNWVYDVFYERFIKSVDGWDNGVDAFPGEMKPNYIDKTSLAHRIQMMNQQERGADSTEQDRRFLRAVKITTDEILTQLDFTIKHILPGAQKLKKFLEDSLIPISKGFVLEIPQGISWEDSLYALDQDQKVSYVLWEDEKKHWCIQTPRVHEASFKSRKPFPKPWRGFSGRELEDRTGEVGSYFCHRSGFFAVALSRETALRLIQLSLDDS